MPLILLIFHNASGCSLGLKWNENASISDWEESV